MILSIGNCLPAGIRMLHLVKKRCFMRKYVSAAIFIMLITVSSPLWATWSIVAVDPVTGEVGSAGASYTPSVWPILGIAGGHGVLVAQAAGNERARVKALRMLLEDLPADQIMNIITDPASNSRRDNQQFGLVSLNGGSAGFTGKECEPFAGHIGNSLVMVQGNILVSESVTADSLEAFMQARNDGANLTSALVAALSAGAAAGGDKRAGDPEISAMSAYLAVASPGDPPGYAASAIIVPPLPDGGNPVKELERIYENQPDPGGLYFPSMNILIMFFLLLPSVFGAALYLVFTAIRKKSGAMTALVWAGAVFGSIFLQQLVIVILARLGWALPVYGYFARIYPVMLAVILLVLISVIILIKKMIRWVRGREAGAQS